MSSATDRPPRASSKPRLLIGYEHNRCNTNTDVILPVDGPIVPDTFESTAIELAARHAPACPVCGAPMDFAIWGPHDDGVEGRWPLARVDAPPRASDPVACSFCGKDRRVCKRLVSGRGGVYICGECVELSAIICEEPGQP